MWFRRIEPARVIPLTIIDYEAYILKNGEFKTVNVGLFTLFLLNTRLESSKTIMIFTQIAIYAKVTTPLFMDRKRGANLCLRLKFFFAQRLVSSLDQFFCKKFSKCYSTT